ncbi:helix-turn-helix domain-containing protein [Enterococcus thailandicus]
MIREKSTIYDLRRAKRMTQKSLAERTGITERTIVTYEMDVKNLRKASYENVEKIADALDVRIDQIFLSSTSEKPKQESAS